MANAFGHTGEKALHTLVKQGLLKGANSCKLKFREHCVLGKQTPVNFWLKNSPYKRNSELCSQ